LLPKNTKKKDDKKEENKVNKGKNIRSYLTDIFDSVK